MRTILAAVAILLAVGYFWLALHEPASLPPLLENRYVPLWKDICVAILAFIIFVDQLVRKNHSPELELAQAAARAAESAASIAVSERSEMAERLSESERVTAELRKQSSALEEDARDSKVALVAAQQQLADLKAAPVAVRSESIDAELVNLLSQFQDKGRFVDFLMEDISSYPDAQVAAAARVVHQGCSAVVREHFSITPAHLSKEGDAITVESVDASGSYRLVGNVGGMPPFRGVVLHRGWKTERVSLPRVVQETLSPERSKLIAPTQVEIS